MGFLDGLWNSVVKPIGSIASVIPGVGSWVGPAIAGVDALLGGNKSQGQANQADAYTQQALARQQQLLESLDPLFKQYMSEVGQDPFAGFDPTNPNQGYDPSSDFAQSDEFNSVLGNELQRQMAAIDYNLPANSSATAAAKASAIRNAHRTRTAEQLKLMAGSRERRYQDFQNRQMARRQAMQQALSPIFGGGNLAGAGVAQQQAGQYRTDAANRGNSLAAAVEAVAKSGVFGKPGTKRGNGTTGKSGQTNPAVSQQMQMALGPDPATYNPGMFANPYDVPVAAPTSAQAAKNWWEVY